MLFFNAIQTALFSAIAGFAAPETPPQDIEAVVPEADEEIGEPRTWDWCSASASGGGRQLARVTVSAQDPDVCIREKLGGSGAGLDNCWKVAARLGCSEVIDYN